MSGCELPLTNALDEEVARILRQARTVAVVGFSPKPERDSHRVALYLKEQGYVVFPVNPACSEALGGPCHPDLASVPGPVDVVDIFRKPEAIPELVDQAIAIGARCVWMQLGLAHNEAADKARAAGLDVVMNKCILREHKRLLTRPEPAGA